MNILLSIQPKWAELILAGEKTAELRRVVPRSLYAGDVVVLYASSPVQRVVGEFAVDGFVLDYAEGVWKRAALSSREAALDYLGGGQAPGAILAKAAKRYRWPYELPFRPPQSYRYLTGSLWAELCRAQATAKATRRGKTSG